MQNPAVMPAVRLKTRFLEALREAADWKLRSDGSNSSYSMVWRVVPPVACHTFETPTVHGVKCLVNFYLPDFVTPVYRPSASITCYLITERSLVCCASLSSATPDTLDVRDILRSVSFTGYRLAKSISDGKFDTDEENAKVVCSMLRAALLGRLPDKHALV